MTVVEKLAAARAVTPETPFERQLKAEVVQLKLALATAQADLEKSEAALASVRAEAQAFRACERDRALLLDAMDITEHEFTCERAHLEGRFGVH